MKQYPFHPNVPFIPPIVFILFVILSSQAGRAQSMPGELVGMDIDQLMGLQILQYRQLPSSRAVATQEGRVSRDSASISYRYVRARFEGYRNGTDRLSFAEVLEQFPVVPTRIKQEAHSVDVAYDTGREWSAHVTIPYIRQETDHIRRKGAPFTIESEGVGDIAFSAACREELTAHTHVTWLPAVSLPTGSISETGETPRGPDTLIPYTMQIGSGTFDLQPSVILDGKLEQVHWGTQIGATWRLGRNQRNYSLGDRTFASAWLSYREWERIMPTVKLLYQDWETIDGEDKELDGSIAPVANAELQGGNRLDVVLSTEFQKFSGMDMNPVLRLEAVLPLHQDLDGPQPEEDWQLSVAIGLRF